MLEDENHRGRTRYTLAETEHGHAWGVCAEAEGLFGEPQRGTYELFGWIPQAEVHGWIGSRVWLVPEDEELDPWLLEDAESQGPLPGADSLVLTGLDEYEGPPEGYRGPVRVHDEHRWLGSCREFARVLPAKQSASPLVLRLRHSVTTAAADAASGRDQRGAVRQLRSELRILSALPVAELRAQADVLAKEIREVDTLIQRTNWEIDLIED
ncbi:DIP1984 family protein [Kitasatospora sp. NPDC001660]